VSEGRFRVLVLADSRAFHTERYVLQMRRQGCHILLASFERGTTHHHHLKRQGFVRRLHYGLGALEIRRIVKRFRPDVINPHYISGYGFAAALAKAQKHAPLFMHLWGSDVLLVPGMSGLHRYKVAYTLKRANFVCADSEYLLNAARGISKFSCRTGVIPWGLEERFLELHKKDYALHKPLRILVPRSHEKVYGNLFIVQALAQLIVEDRVRLTFPKSGTRCGQFLERARSLVGDRIHLYEKLSRQDFMQLMAQHDVYLSNAASDSSPVSMIEAMGLGLIPVAADIPGVREWLGEQKGFRYKPGTPEQLTEVVVRLLDSNDPLQQLRQRNLDLVRSKAIFENNVAETIAIMRDLAAKRTT